MLHLVYIGEKNDVRFTSLTQASAEPLVQIKSI